MSSPPVQIVGFSSTDKAPGFVGEVKYGSGSTGAAGLPNICLLYGTKTSAGTATANQDILPVFSEADADTYFGPGSELARMCYAAFKATRSTGGLTLYAMPGAEAGSAVAGTLTVTFTGPATATGVYGFRLDGEYFEFGIASGDTATTVGLAFTNAINSRTRLAATASPTAGVVVVTRKSAGQRGNNGSFFSLPANLPAGVTATVSVGTGITGATNGYRFASGSLSEDVTTALSVAFAGDYRHVAIPTDVSVPDSTNLGRWETSISAKAGPLEGRPSFVVCAHNGNTSPVSPAQTNNDPLFQFLWLRNGEAHPCEMAAAMAAVRSVTEQADPGAAYDGRALDGLAPQTNPADVPQRSVNVAALNSGVTPLTTTRDGKVRVVRSITAHSLLSGTSTPDYTTLDTGDAYVPQYVRLDLALLWAQVFYPANPRVADNDPSGKPRPARVATPALWNATVQARLKTFEDGVNGSPPLLIDVDANPPESGYDSTAKRIMTLCPVKPAPSQHQIGVSIRQLSLSFQRLSLPWRLHSRGQCPCTTRARK